MTSNESESSIRGDNSLAPPVRAARSSRNRNDWTEEELVIMRRQWYYLYTNFQKFKSQKPEDHPLFAKAISVMPKDESLEYYRGVYETLCAMNNLITIAKETERNYATASGMECEPKDAPMQMREAVQRQVITLQTGYTIGQMLKQWPKDGEPTIKNTPPLPNSEDTADEYNSDNDGPGSGNITREYNSDDDTPE